MSKYLFRLEKMHVNAKRNLVKNEQDWDVITFGIEVGPQQYGPLKDYGSPSADSGTDLVFNDGGYFRHGPPGVGGGGRWEIGPIEVADTDIVSVNYGVVNAKHTLSHSGTTQTTIAISATTWATLVAAGGAAGGVPGAVVGAIAAGIAAVVGLLLTDVPNCDGTVGGNKRLFTGTELKQATNNPQQMFSFSDRSGNPTAPDGCGASDIVMTFSVRYFPYYSLKDFMSRKFGSLRPAQDRLRVATNFEGLGFYNGPTTSVRDIIENYEFRVIQ